MGNTFTEPQVTEREALVYAGFRVEVSMEGLGGTVNELILRMENWLIRHGLELDGPPLVRYHTIDMDALLDITVGFPVPEGTALEGPGTVEVLPAGQYAALTFTGGENGIEGNGALIRWIAEQGLGMDYVDSPLGQKFAGRVEFMLDGPDDDPNPSNWRTEVAIKLTKI